MSAQRQGVGVGGEHALSRTEREVKNEQNIQFRWLFVLTRGELSTCRIIMCNSMNGGYSQEGR